MKFAIQVNAAPNTPASLSALGFIEAALVAGHEVVRVFFYHDGVYCASGPNEWSRLAREKRIDLVVCVSAAYRRGVIQVDEAEHSAAYQSLLEGFRLGGLGMWMNACLLADRFIAFDC
jgi:tRNA 2-thiouridine synthesizing protein D